MKGVTRAMKPSMRILSGLTIAACAMWASAASAQLKVVTTDTNLADIARQVGGNRVTVESLTRGNDDPHHIDPRPSMVVKLARADVFARMGMDLDMWADSLLERCGNRNVQRGGKGYVDCSGAIKPLEVPTGRLDPSLGDIHAFGNPHYILDPANGVVAAAAIAGGLIRVDPSNRARYEARLNAFRSQISAGIKKWRERLASVVGKPVVEYHRNMIYFFKRFGLVEYDAVEPKPGVPPSPGHLQALIARMKRDNVRIILFETYRDRRYADRIASQVGARLVIAPIAVDAEPGVTTYFELFDRLVARLAGEA